MILPRFSPLFIVATVFAASTRTQQGGPTIQLDQGLFTGTSNGTVTEFLGIPYARPPVGNLRLRLPVPNDAYSGTFNASAFGPACPQQAIQLTALPSEVPDEIVAVIKELFTAATPVSEDCAYSFVWCKTPGGCVDFRWYVWLHTEGGSMDGSPTSYDGGVIVQRSIDVGQPIVYVSINYRLSAFGFLDSTEVRDAGVTNLGLRDQRQALRWVQKYISAFGGDPSRVVLWGQSAGSMSTATHMLINGGDTEGLFHGAFMESGSPLPVGDGIARGDMHFASIVEQTGCANATEALECLRGVPYGVFQQAVDSTPGLASPEDCDDEGTITALLVSNITTEDELRAYITAPFLLPNISSTELDQLLTLYPANVSAGSPFDTGSANAVSPQYKRIAALHGDLVFQGPRRFFLQQRAGKQPVWAFLSKRDKALPILGSVHGSDVVGNMYAPGDLTDFLINFVNHLDPNGKTGSALAWPQYTPDSPQLMTLLDGDTPQVISEDTYRQEAIAFLQKLSLE